MTEALGTSSAAQVDKFVDPYDFQQYDGYWGNLGYGLMHPEIEGAEGYGDQYVSRGESFGERLTDKLGLTDYKGRYEEWKAQRDRAYERASINSARAWELYLDNTKHQREVADLKAAGLNPWLAVQNGLHSSSAGSSTATGGKSSAKQSQGDNSALGYLILALGKVIAALI